jgi:legumain
VNVGDAPFVEAIMTQSMQERRGMPLVDSWDCLRAYVAAYESVYGTLSQYGAQHTRTFANLCNAGLEAASWQLVLATQAASILQCRALLEKHVSPKTHLNARDS